MTCGERLVFLKVTMRGRVEVVCRHELLSERELRESGKSYKDWNR